MNCLDPLVAAGLTPPTDGADAALRSYAWAIAAHSGQVRRDGSRLIDHVVGVARNVQRFGPPDAALLCAALLHDVVENTDVPLEEVRRREGSRVARLVDAVTNRPGEDPRDSALRARDAGPDALLLRLCDRLDGIRRSPGRPEGNRAKFLAVSRLVHLPLADEHLPALGEAIRGALERAEATLA